jgi:hypothetical protein
MEIAENNEEALVGANSRKRKAANIIEALGENDDIIGHATTEEQSSLANANSTTAEEEKNLEQIYVGPPFNSDLRIVYENACFHVHSQILIYCSK